MSNFKLNNEEIEFQSRTNDVFSQLDNIKNSLKHSRDVNSIERKRKESSKTPPTSNKPDFEIHPERWEKYNLKETTVESDRQNTQTALSFLHKLSKRPKVSTDNTFSINTDKTKLKGEDGMDVDSDLLPMHKQEDLKTSAVVFKKPSVHKMPEYQVGKACHKKTKSLTNTESETVCSKVELDHLEENVSAAEFQAEMAVKLEEAASSRSTEMVHSVSNEFSFKKTTPRCKTHHNVRKRTTSNDK